MALPVALPSPPGLMGEANPGSLHRADHVNRQDAVQNSAAIPPADTITPILEKPGHGRVFSVATDGDQSDSTNPPILVNPPVSVPNPDSSGNPAVQVAIGEQSASTDLPILANPPVSVPNPDGSSNSASQVAIGEQGDSTILTIPAAPVATDCASYSTNVSILPNPPVSVQDPDGSGNPTAADPAALPRFTFEVELVFVVVQFDHGPAMVRGPADAYDAVPSIVDAVPSTMDAAPPIVDNGIPPSPVAPTPMATANLPESAVAYDSSRSTVRP